MHKRVRSTAMHLAVLSMCILLIAGCGGASRTFPAVVSRATTTSTSAPTVVPTYIHPTATNAGSAVAATCQPDPNGIYASQTFGTLPATGDIPSLPNTKRGHRDWHLVNTAGVLTQNLCSLGTQASLSTYIGSHLPPLGWQHGQPPASVATACGWTGQQWWQGTSLIRWSYDGAAGNGSYFWSYITCAIATS